MSVHLSSRMVVRLAECAFEGESGDCTPEPVEECADAVRQSGGAFPVNHPNGFDCAALFTYELTVEAEGHAALTWSAQERDATECTDVGEPTTGSMKIGFCCEQAVELYFAGADATYRFAVTADYEP